MFQEGSLRKHFPQFQMDSDIDSGVRLDFLPVQEGILGKATPGMSPGAWKLRRYEVSNPRSKVCQYPDWAAVHKSF